MNFKNSLLVFFTLSLALAISSTSTANDNQNCNLIIKGDSSTINLTSRLDSLKSIAGKYATNKGYNIVNEDSPANFVLFLNIRSPIFGPPKSNNDVQIFEFYSFILLDLDKLQITLTENKSHFGSDPTEVFAKLPNCPSN